MPQMRPGVGEVTDHIALALSRLPHMYKGADAAHETNTQKVLRALLAPAAALEAAMQQVLTQRAIDTAVGVQLTALGKLVGMDRQGVTDDEIYRRFVRAAVVANKSNGLIDDILTIGKLVVNDVGAVFTLRNEGAAAFVLAISGVAVTDAVAAVLIKLIRQATGAGIRAILEYSSAAPSTVFVLDLGPSEDVGHYATALE
jgi:hypothetical protein